jgi:hypothetical protein
MVASEPRPDPHGAHRPAAREEQAAIGAASSRSPAPVIHNYPRGRSGADPLLLHALHHRASRPSGWRSGSREMEHLIVEDGGRQQRAAHLEVLLEGKRYD